MGGKGSGNRTKSNPFTAKKAENVDPDVNRRTIAYTRALMNLPDFDRGSVEETKARVNLFFDLCEEHGMRPLVGNFAAMLGMSKVELWNIVNGIYSGRELGVTPETALIYKNTLRFIESNFEQVLMDAKNPVSAIYYSKSNLGWREAPAETIITHKTEKPQLSGKTTAEIEAKYKALAGVVENVEDASGEQAQD